MSLPHCPNALPEDLAALVAEFGRAWAKSQVRPSPNNETLKHWESLIQEWAADPKMPLFVRKHRNDRGTVQQHHSGRALVPVDNSSAQWVFSLACEGVRPSLEEVALWLSEDKVPVAMIQKAVERKTATYHHRLPKESNVNLKGWKLAHISPAGLKTRKPLAVVPLEELKAKFVSFMSPSNMFVVPLAWGGIAEARSVIEAVAAWNSAQPVLSPDARNVSPLARAAGSGRG